MKFDLGNQGSILGLYYQPGVDTQLTCSCLDGRTDLLPM